jgi:tetratricopeptide (TPR) repeat protein/transglutaminase-like putative cysteine protease
MRLTCPLIVFLLAWMSPIPGLTQVKPPEKQAAPAPEYSQEAYVINRYYVRFSAEADGTGTRELTAEVKVLADAGVKAFAVLSFTYSSANEVVDVDYVRVRKPDGTVVQTPDYNIQDMPGEVTRTAPLYSDIHEKHIAVKALQLGDVLEYQVRFRVVKPEVPGQFWYEHSFLKDAIVKDERLEISVPSAKQVKIVSPEFQPEVKEEGGRRVYRWTHSSLKREEKDPAEVPRRIPPNPSIQVTTFSNWEDVGRWYGELQKAPLEVTPAIQAKAAELTRGLKTDDEKLHAIYNFVSLQFHYIGLDFGIGRYQPHAADDVLGNNYGDCKDKHTLLAALLKAAGYEAWPALIHARRKLDPDVPSPAQFNHVITVVPRGDQMIWLDTTPEVAPYGLLLNVLRDKQALVIPSNKPPVLMTTPANPPFPLRQEFSVKGKLGSDDTFTGHIEQVYRGDSEVVLRTGFRQVAQAQWKEAAQRFSYGLNFAGDVSNVTVTPPEDLEKPFELSYDYVRKNYGDWDNRQIMAPLPPMGIEVTKDSKDKKPQEPVLLGALGKIVYRSSVELPRGYLMIPPKAVNLVEPYAEYHATYAVENGVLTTTRQLEIKKSEVVLSDWEAYRKFGRAVGDDEFSFMRLNGSGDVVAEDSAEDDKDIKDEDLDETLRKGIDALQVRDAKRAQKLFERIIAKDPKHKGAHLNLGAALGQQTKFSEALAEVRKEEEIFPEETRAYTVAASMASGSGHRDDAIAEWRKLLKVDPENRVGATSLSQTLYEGGQYAEAAEVLESFVQASPGDASLQYSLGSAYLKAGQSDKGVDHMRAAVEASADGAMMRNNVAYALAESKASLPLARQYGEGALSYLEAHSRDDVAATDKGTALTYQFSLVWDTLGWVYFQSGETNRAESFVRSAWLLGQDPVVGEHLGEICEKEGKNKEAAHVYELALAAVPAQLFYGPLGDYSPQSTPLAASFENARRQQLENSITSRYQKLTGRKPSINETVRLPAGGWTKTAGEQLSEMRTAKFGKLPISSGTAEFTIVFAPGKIESVEYVSGEQSLKGLSERVKAAHFAVEFPTGSQARILRRAELSCFPISGCMAVLMPVGKARTGQNPGQVRRQE